MALSHFLDRKVVYTPLRLCSAYCGVMAAVACAAALVDRERTNIGREIHASRLASSLAAIGALTLTIDGPKVSIGRLIKPRAKPSLCNFVYM